MFALRRSTLALRPAFQARAFVAAPRCSKDIAQTVKEVGDTVNRVVSDTVLKGVETAEQLAGSTKESAKESASPLTDAVKDAVGDATTEAKKAGADVYGEAYKAKADIENSMDKASRS